MIKTDLAAQVHEECSLTKKDSALLVEEAFEEMRRALRAGEKVKIRGFGNFRMRALRPRMGRNLNTGEAVQIPAGRRLAFQATQKLKDALNNPEPPPPAPKRTVFTWI